MRTKRPATAAQIKRLWTNRQQDVMALRFIAGWRLKDIATELKMRKQSVQLIIERAQHRLERAGFPRATYEHY